jgi:hypothetical protein
MTVAPGRRYGQAQNNNLHLWVEMIRECPVLARSLLAHSSKLETRM